MHWFTLLRACLHVLSRSEGIENYSVTSRPFDCASLVYTCFPVRRELKLAISIIALGDILSLHVLSRSEGIETQIAPFKVKPQSVRLHVLSRSEGIETWSRSFLTIGLTKVYTCFPVRRELKPNVRLRIENLAFLCLHVLSRSEGIETIFPP